MRPFLLVLMVFYMSAITCNQQTCSGGSTAATGCYNCATGAADSDCNYCDDGYYKIGAKACTPCPKGTGRTRAGTFTDIESSVECTVKSAPQLNCGGASDRYRCASCSAGLFIEIGSIFDGQVEVTGCSKDCKSFGGKYFQLVPKQESPPAPGCIQCRANCKKCEFTNTLKACAGNLSPGCVLGYDPQQTVCTECAPGFYLKPNKDEPNAVVPSCDACGANCKKCKDATACDTCYPGWALDGQDKANCLKPASMSSKIIQLVSLCILAFCISW